jgi:hypothetical protein
MHPNSTELRAYLSQFEQNSKIQSKGPLCVVLVVTRHAAKKTFPLNSDDFLTAKKGQVRGLGRSAVQNILQDHGVTRVLAEEGGRTSRGSIERMRAYVQLLNRLESEKLLNFNEIETFWVERVQAFFASQPFKLKLDPSKSLRNIVSDLVESAFTRQKECPGTMVAGAVMQHLVGAKLEIALPEIRIDHAGFSSADAPGGRKGDFLVGDTAIHVTTAPSEALIRKCVENIEQSIRPVIITTQSGFGGAMALAKNWDIEKRIDILEIEQFVATNILEWSEFLENQRPLKVRALIEAYNRIVEKVETDPSLKISAD